MTTTITYLGRNYEYPLLTAEDLGRDRVVSLNLFEAKQQGFELCYNESRRFHFLIQPEELVKFNESLE